MSACVIADLSPTAVSCKRKDTVSEGSSLCRSKQRNGWNALLGDPAPQFVKRKNAVAEVVKRKRRDMQRRIAQELVPPTTNFYSRAFFAPVFFVDRLFVLTGGCTSAAALFLLGAPESAAVFGVSA